MDRSTFRIAFATLLLGLAVSLVGCMDASLSQSSNAPTSISIQDAPSTLGDIDLTISGPGMSDISETVTRGTDAIIIDVPVGPEREFEAVGFLNEDITAFYQGLSRVGVGAAGLQVGLPMRLRSRIVIPDGSVGVISQIDSLSTGDSSAVFDSFFFGVRDVDFDRSGRMYLAASSDVTRSDGISGNNQVALGLGGGSFRSVAIDRARGLLFASSDFNVTKANLDGTDEVFPLVTENDLITPSSLSYFIIQGIAVDRDGYLYVAQSPGVSKVDPDTGAVLAQFLIPGHTEGTDGVSDVRIWNDTVLVLNRDTASANAALYQLDLALETVIDSYGRTTTPADQKGEFIGPLRFLATLNRKITIAERSAAPDARLVSIEGMSGTGWETYGTYGTGGSSSIPGEFTFYSYSFGS